MVIFDEYEKEALSIVTKLYPNANPNQLKRAIEYSISKRYKEEPCCLDNNYTNKKVDLTILQMTEYIKQKKPICTAYGVMFKQPGEVPNPLVELIRSFLVDRDVYKTEMLSHAKGSDEYAKYMLFQLLAKRDANSIYGCIGNMTCMLYNINVAASITCQGRALISNATMFFEGFLSNGVKFSSLEEVAHFIHRVCEEKNERAFNDSVILDRNITVAECFSKLVMSCGDFRKGSFKWIPDTRDLNIIFGIVQNLCQEDINRIYYKNNLYEFLNNSSMSKALVYILKELKLPYMACAKVPDEIRVELDALQDFLREYVYYKHIWIDRIDRCDSMIKNVCAISDTDSTIVCFDPFYRFVLDKIRNEDIEISKIKIDMFKMLGGDEYIEPFKVLPNELDYDFNTEEIVEKQGMMDPFIFMPQDNLRYSIINIIAYISGNLCNEYNIEFTKMTGSFSPDKKCALYLKNEWLFKRGLLTNGKKNYATCQEVQEGKIIPKGIKTQLDIKGMPMNKSSVNKEAKARMQSIVFDKILNCDTIDQVDIIKSLAILKTQIVQSLERGEKKFCKPVTIKALAVYDDPMRIQGVKAAVIWNKVKDDSYEIINLEERNTIDILKVNISPSNIGIIQDSYPETYNKFVELFKNTTIFAPKAAGIKYDITAIALPIKVEIPDWVKGFIDYTAIVTDSIGTFPLESVGICTFDTKNVNYSNIMKL